MEFVNKETGTLRHPDGKLLAHAGRHADLDALAAKFMRASQGDKPALVAEADSVASGLSNGGSAPLYAAGHAYVAPFPHCIFVTLCADTTPKSCRTLSRRARSSPRQSMRG